MPLATGVWAGLQPIGSTLSSHLYWSGGSSRGGGGITNARGEGAAGPAAPDMKWTRRCRGPELRGSQPTIPVASLASEFLCLFNSSATRAPRPHQRTRIWLSASHCWSGVPPAFIGSGSSQKSPGGGGTSPGVAARRGEAVPQGRQVLPCGKPPSPNVHTSSLSHWHPWDWHLLRRADCLASLGVTPGPLRCEVALAAKLDPSTL